jgi:hypothetical protein
MEEVDDPLGEIVGVEIEAEGGAGYQSDRVQHNGDLAAAPRRRIEFVLIGGGGGEGMGL